ncbi:EC38 protein [Colletotrichum higginsianum IMI 349063]|uniref:EC38 protein n=2 Tax=Colletotrichum higginsianum TaxID=80884 RepID=A0A1B7YL82_COLHI|nr:EC38 protein [Colletotrichum higginsianum IMI 349063]OBR12799.1 EC38 protein [Colletotrichum higginsianum IMI 349063]TID00053.1 hypothetical protein CH35J_005119 [Colletotrichum higginsianum]
MQISLKTLYIAAATLMAASSVSADSCSRWNGDKCPDNRPVSCGDGCCCETLNVCPVWQEERDVHADTLGRNF